jgi:hypothetical protein
MTIIVLLLSISVPNIFLYLSYLDIQGHTPTNYTHGNNTTLKTGKVTKT